MLLCYGTIVAFMPPRHLRHFMPLFCFSYAITESPLCCRARRDVAARGMLHFAFIIYYFYYWEGRDARPCQACAMQAAAMPGACCHAHACLTLSLLRQAMMPVHHARKIMADDESLSSSPYLVPRLIINFHLEGTIMMMPLRQYSRHAWVKGRIVGERWKLRRR